MAQLNVYRIPLQAPLLWNEQVGDPVTNQGGAPVPAIRAALRHSATMSTIQSTGGETVEARMALRRRMRSLLNNAPFKLQGVFIAYEDDPDQSGWYIPDQGQITDLEGYKGIGAATGLFSFENFVWIKAGSPRTHRRASAVLLKDTRTGEWPRDQRRGIYSTDFAALTPLAITYLPPGATDITSTGELTAGAAFAVPAGADGGQNLVLAGAVDLSRISYEQTEANRNKGQVVAYDRRQELTNPAAGAGPGWEEMYGPDYPYSWMGAGATMDIPVLENQRCRVRLDTAGSRPGFAIDAWTGAAWEEQGKVMVQRRAAANNIDDTITSASLLEYNETRAVVQVVMSSSADSSSREEVFITLQRGWSGPKIEVYPGRESGTAVTAALIYTIALADTDDSLIKIDAAGAGAIQATAKGTGHTGFYESLAPIGAATFTGENGISIGRWKGTTEALKLGCNIAVFQAGAEIGTDNTNTAYGATRSVVNVFGPASSGWVGMQLGYYEQKAQQAMEAENMTLSSGTSSTADAAASNGKAATATRTADAAHVTQTTWPNGDKGVYRVFARVKTSASTLNIYGKTSLTTGATKTTTSATYVWVDLGDIQTNNGTVEIHMWATAAATTSLDRIEAFLVEDHETAAGGVYEGARDLGQRVLQDSRATPTLVTRTV